MAETTFPLRPFPQRLMRSLTLFAVAGTVMALTVWHDGTGGPWLAPAIAIACWGLPALFAWQIRSQGYDPLVKLVVTDAGVEAHDRSGHARFMAWGVMTRLVEVLGLRYRAWALVGDGEPVRWFGELENLEAFQRLASERTGLSWETESRLPGT